MNDTVTAKLIDEACKYPLLMRIAARLVHDGETEISFAEKVFSPRGPFQNLRGELIYPALHTIRNYIRDFEISGGPSRLNKTQLKRLSQLAAEL